MLSGMYERKCTAKHGTAGHSREQHGAARGARHRTTPHDVAPRCWASYAERGSTVRFLFSSYTQLGVTQEKSMSPHLRKRLDVPTSCHRLGRKNLGRQTLGHLCSTWIALRGRACLVFGRLITPPRICQVSTCQSRRVSGGNSE